MIWMDYIKSIFSRRQLDISKEKKKKDHLKKGFTRLQKMGER